jgi:hypothetical protein
MQKLWGYATTEAVTTAISLITVFCTIRFTLTSTHAHNKIKQKTKSVVLVRKRTIPTERPPLVGEVSARHDATKTYLGGAGGAPPVLTSLLDTTVHKNHLYIIFLCTFSVNCVDCITTHSKVDFVLMSTKINITLTYATKLRYMRATTATDLGALTCTNLFFRLCMELVHSHESAKPCTRSCYWNRKVWGSGKGWEPGILSFSN